MVFIPRWERYRDKKPSCAVELDLSHELTKHINACVYNGVDVISGSYFSVYNGAQFKDGNFEIIDGQSHYYIANKNLSPKSLPASATILNTTHSSGIWQRIAYSSKGYTGIQIQISSSNLYNFAIGDTATTTSPRAYGYSSNTIALNKKQLFTLSLHNTANFSCFLDNSIDTVNGTLTEGTSVYNPGAETDTSEIGRVFYNGSYYYGGSNTIELLIYSKIDQSIEWHQALNESPYQILKPRRRWFVFGSGTSGLTVIINSAGEVVSANQLTGVKLLNLPNSAETSLAQQTGAAKTASISNSAENSATSAQGSEKAALSGISPEIDTAFNTFTLKEFTLNYSTEVDSGNIFSFTSTSGITTATSAELASNVTTAKTLNVLPGTSAVSAGNFTSGKILQLHTSTETTTANAFTYSQLSGITTASESSIALGFSFTGTVVLGNALESAFAKTITASKVVLTNLAAETSLSNQLTTAKSLTLTLASELNIAASFLYSSITGIGTAFSAETATSVLGTIYATLYPSLENNIVLGITSETINWDFAVKTLKIIKTSRKVTIN